MRFVSKVLTALLIVTCGAGVTFAQTTQSGPQVHKLTVSPIAPADRAMQYRLTHVYLDQTPGNAATVYMAAMLVLANQPQTWNDNVDRLQAMPMDQLPRDEARALLKEAEPMLALLHVGARREFCQWDLTRREQVEMALLPHLHRMRPFTRLLSLNTRMALLDGRFEDAADSLRTSLSFARDCQSNDATVLDGLVAAGISKIVMDDIAAFIGTPGAPNIYWPLANLPRPLLDMPSIIRRERGYLLRIFPELRDPRASRLTDERWREIEISALRDIRPEPPTKPELEKLDKQIAQINATLLPKAKAHLKAGGMSDGEVESIPAAQALAIYCVAETERWRDEREKWFGVPFWQGYPGLFETDRAIREVQAQEPNPLMSLEPNTTRWAKKLVEPDRESAALQTIEAIRAHAATNDGKPPGKLGDVVLPLPVDPATGQPMQYEPREGGFSLISHLPEGEAADEIRYEVTVK